MITISDSDLDLYRTEGDPAADAAVAALFRSGQLADVQALLNTLRENDQLVPAALPAELQGYLEQTAALPAWTDRARIEAGEALFGRLGPSAVTVLMCSSLPQCYAAEKGAKVLGFTQRLQREPERRIVETAQFVLDVMAPGGLLPSGRGVRSAQKVRLMHAALRYLIQSRPEWDPAWGVPINQEDLAGTLYTFSTVVLDGLKTLGATLSDDEERAYVHAWRVVGHLLGVRSELLLDEPAEARALFAKICARQHRPSDLGRALTRALIDFLEHMTPGTLFDRFPAELIHHLVGDSIAAMVGVPAPDGPQRLLGILQAITGAMNGLEERSSLMARAGDHFARAMIGGLEWVERRGRAVTFQIPTGLRVNWAFLPPRA